MFALAAVAAAALWLWVGRHQWFWSDEWEFLATRSLGDPGSLLRGHFGHWTTTPAVAYRVLWEVFGLRTYVPYQLLAVGSHVALAALTRVVMRRAGVSPWVATIAASILLFYGAGRGNIIHGFQVTFTAGLVFGVVHLLLADHEGGLDRRDVVGLVSGLLALTCSATGIIMVVVVGITVLIRRGLLVAMVHTVPLLVLYGAWWSAHAGDDRLASDGPPRIVDWTLFVGYGVWSAFVGIAQVPYVHLILLALLVGGLLVAVSESGPRAVISRAAAPLALLVGAALFLVMAGYGRISEYGRGHSGESRYIYVVAALMLPALAVAVDSLIRRWPKESPILLAVLLVGVPTNIAVADDRPPTWNGTPDLVLALPEVPRAEEAPRDRPLGDRFYEGLTIGWLLDGVAEGRVPEPEVRSDAIASVAKLWVWLGRSTESGGDCEPAVLGEVMTLDPGSSVAFTKDLSLHEGGADPSTAQSFDAEDGRVEVLVGPIDLVLNSESGSVEVCTPVP